MKTDLKPAKILLATKNQGKIAEMNTMLRALDIEIVGISELEATMQSQSPEVEESGSTFAENALLKAQAYSAWSQLPVIAEDSGLCVEALNGAPGVYSARFSGEEATDQKNNEKLLLEMSEVPDGQRHAWYETSIVFLFNSDATPIYSQGKWHGSVLQEPRGDGGFGYDPLFWVEVHQCSSAELKPEMKNALSHRGQAVSSLVELLNELWIA